jgi:hypothetical protein
MVVEVRTASGEGHKVVEGLLTEVTEANVSPFHTPLPLTVKSEGIGQSMSPNLPIVPSINLSNPYPSLPGVVTKQVEKQSLLSPQKYQKEIRPVETVPTLCTPATQKTHKNQKSILNQRVKIRPGLLCQTSTGMTQQSQTVTYPSCQAMSSTLWPQITRPAELLLQTGSGPGWITLPTRGQHIDYLSLTLSQSHPHLPVGGRLTHFLQGWQLLIQDKFAKSVVKNGYQIDWLHHPPPLSDRVVFTQLHQKQDLLLAEIQEMLQKGAIEKVMSPGPGFCSTFFLVPKKDTDQMRPVINLKGLNKFVKCPTFKMHSPSSIIRMIHKGNWLASIDLKDAYFHVPVHQRHYKFLRFAFQGTIYQFKVLPFGLSTAPRVFTKVLAPVVGYLHQQGIFLFPYLDDCLLVAKDQVTLHQAIMMTIQTLHTLGFMINFKKSHLQMTQRITFLGMEIDTLLSKVFLPRQKAENLIKVAMIFLQVGTYHKARHFLKFLGLMASTLIMVPQARLYMRPIQIYLNATWDRKTMSLNHKIMIPLRLFPIIQWWTNVQNLLKGVEFPPKKHSVMVTTDASLTAWGAHCKSHKVQGKWNPHQRTLHINILELLAVWNALKAFLHLVQNRTVLIQTDNTSVLHYINNSGGTKSVLLCQMTWDMLHWCLKHKVELKAVHIPGKDNHLADKLSRIWPTPTIDLFASFQNTKLNRFCALRYHPLAESTDALEMCWRNLYAYAFPPFPILARVLQKVREDQASLILIAPNWARREWFPLLLDLIVDYPWQLPLIPNLISQDQGRQIHPDLLTLRLVAWKVSGITSFHKAFLTKLQQRSLSLRQLALEEHTQLAGHITLPGVNATINIPILQMFIQS